MTSEKAPELKPCPFCGASDPSDVFVERRDDGRTWEVTCDAAECLSAGPIRATKREAIAAWNDRRAEVADAMVAAACETLVKAAGTFCWNRYDESRMKTPAVFTSHTHQRIEEALRQAIPADARAALAEAEHKAWEAGRDAAAAWMHARADALDAAKKAQAEIGLESDPTLTPEANEENLKLVFAIDNAARAARADARAPSQHSRRSQRHDARKPQ